MKKTAARLIRMTNISVRWSFDWANWNPTEKEYRQAISCVQLDEKERLGRFVFRKDARASLVGRLMMRKFINEYCHVPYNKINITRDANNRPLFENETNVINFNVSHQGKFTVLAGESRDVKLGIDIMKLEYTGGKELTDFFRIMNRNFSSSEWTEIKGVSGRTETEQTAMFCRHWALKESYVKAIGIGIVIDLKTLNFKTNSALSINEFVTDTTLYINGVKQNWLFEETLIDPEHYIAVALQENDRVPKSMNQKFKKLDFPKLMMNAVPLYPEDEQYAKIYFCKAERPLM